MKTCPIAANIETPQMNGVIKIIIVFSIIILFCVKQTALGQVQKDSSVIPNSEKSKRPYQVSQKLLEANDTIKQDDSLAVKIKVDRGAYFNGKGIGLEEILTETEFKKAACCTLSESFELSNTIEVSNADGASGIKQIEMLGLAGKYVAMSRENIPTNTGLATLNGLSNIPGPMVTAVHLAKGVGSASLGHDGLVGGLNYILKANIKDPKIFFNAYANNQARAEFNGIVKNTIQNKALNHFYLHSGGQYLTTDMGKDGLADMPLYQRFFISDHLQIPGKNTEAQLGFIAYSDQKKGGSIDPLNRNKISDDPTKMQINIAEHHTEIYGKLGIFLSKDGKTSLGNIFQASDHQLNALLNSQLSRRYQGKEQRLFYSSLIQLAPKKNNILKCGITLSANKINEKLNDKLNDTISELWSLNAWQSDIAAFGEYTKEGEKLSMVWGIRVDKNNVYGLFVTPRLHIKYNINKIHRLNFQGGQARRSSYFIAENLPQLINGRNFILDTSNLINKRWMPMEKAWNYGASYLGNFMFMGYPAVLVIDYFETRFNSQIIVDRDASENTVKFHSVSGKQAGKNQALQLDWRAMFHRRWSYSLSYRWLNSKVWLNDQFLQQPLQSVHRIVGSTQFQTRDKWYFDGLFQINSPKRLPYLSGANLPHHPGFSPWYTILNVQIRKSFSSQFEIYLGCENLVNVQIHQPVMNAGNLGGSNFDAGYAWAPTNGRTMYFGLRYSL